MARIVIVTWDGAGNLVSTLGTARALVQRGHDVRLMGHDSILERCGDQGTRFIPYTQAAGWDELDDPADTEAEIELLMDKLCFSSAIAHEVSAELERDPADVVLVDSMLFSAMNVAQASGARTATLFHSPYSVFRGGPLVEMFSPGLPRLNAHRSELGLGAVARLSDVHDACDVALVAVPKEFEPDVRDAANVVRTGPFLDAPALWPTADDVDLEDSATPMVLISLSTSEQGQLPLLQRIADAVATLPVRAVVTTGPALEPSSITAGDNTQVVRYAPHADVLPAASLVITHAGLGTVMSALGHGVPLLCVPMGRDQFFNAERVAALGAGRMLMPDADADAIANAARAMLEDPATEEAAKQTAVTIAGYGGASAGAARLEALASSPR
jgi:UDP:flavonoid glycosyltransferase YjiC (YdhE family)